MAMIFVLLFRSFLIAIVLTLGYAYNNVLLNRRPTLRPDEGPKMKCGLSDNSQHNYAMRTVAAAIPLVPSIVCAADGSSGLSVVAFPVAIAVLTMVPFIYYTQQLKPKPRKVQQIELDEYLRPVKKSDKGKNIK